MSGPRVVVVDYGMGNLANVKRALAHVGCRPLVTDRPADLAEADGVIVPGVGAFPDAARRLAETGLAEAVRAFADTGRPLLGICLGLQLFFEGSVEGEGGEGFGFFPGRIVPLDPGPGLKVPHMGWNTVAWSGDFPLLRGLESPEYFYFVHSFCAPVPEEGPGGGKGDGLTVAECRYGRRRFVAAGHRNNVMATQFHPEKSGRAGLVILENFAAMCRRDA